MIGWATRSFGAALTVIGVALVWLLLFKLNALAFSELALSPRAHWIFLPAPWRVLGVLLFRHWGVVGLMLGAYLTLPDEHTNDLPYELLLSVSSGIAPLIAVVLCGRILPIPASLVGLRGWQILMISTANAAANALLVTGSMAVAGRFDGNSRQVLAIFIGDMAGTAIVLLAIANLLTLITQRKGGGSGAE